MNKLLNNLGIKAINTLGIGQICIVYWNLLLSFPSLIRNKNLVALDKRISSLSNLNIKHKFGSFKVSPKNIDTKIIEEGSYAFSSVRELYIKDCYFKFHKDLNPKDVRVVVDLGANRGMFSTLCSSFCEKIIIVEVQKQYNTVIEGNLAYTGFKNFKIFNKFIGTEGKFKGNEGNGLEFISFTELLKQSNVEVIDFLKIDIEGSEFTLFNEDLPLNKVRYLSMEIHRDYGDVEEIIKKLKHKNFSTITSTSEFEQTNDVSKIDYLYAKNLSFNSND